MKITSVGSILDHAAASYFKEDRGHWVFRGHSNASYKLIPSVGRPPRTSSTVAKHEKSLYHAFRREVVSYVDLSSMSDWQCLALAQHHGLPTRFLDWSHNILVSLYFAVSASPDTDGTLFALHAIGLTPKEVLDSSPFDIKRSTKYYPACVTPRIRAQEGLFISCAKPDSPFEDNMKDVDWSLDEAIVPAAMKPRILYELYRLGIHASSLFPDLDGLTSRIRWSHGITSPLRDASAISATVDNLSPIQP